MRGRVKTRPVHNVAGETPHDLSPSMRGRVKTRPVGRPVAEPVRRSPPSMRGRVKTRPVLPIAASLNTELTAFNEGAGQNPPGSLPLFTCPELGV